MAVLQGHDVQAVADVRRFPASRRHPHFSREALEALLGSRDIEYHWMPELGGRRTPRRDSTNTGWRVAGFRGYADYMETPEFTVALDELLRLAGRRRTAIMCAESLWWQCHRRLISDALTAAGHAVQHIQSPEKAESHKLIAPARIVAGKLDYSADELSLPLD